MVIHKSKMRSDNEKSVLQQIFNSSPISRSEISRALGLNKVTTSGIVNKFIEQGLLIESGMGDSTSQGGRKPELVQINEDYGYVVCFELGFESLSVLSMKLNGEKLTYRTNRFVSEDINLVINKMNETLLDFKNTLKGDLLGVLISVHGIVYQNKIIYSPFWNMQGIDIVEVLKQKFNVPIMLENEANLTAVFEKDFTDNAITNAISISMHKGIGAGIIINGSLYRGIKGEAGEIGQTVAFNSNERPLQECQKIEDICSQEAVLNQIKVVKNLNYIDLSIVRQLFDSQDEVTLRILSNFKHNIAKLMNNIIVSFDPDLLIMNAQIFKALPELLDAIQKNLAQFSFRSTPIILSQNVINASLYGGCALAFQSIFGFSTIKLNYTD